MYIFISHSSLDKPFVRRLSDSLAFYGIPVFLDERSIKVGDNIPDKIYEALKVCTHVIYVLSNNSITSTWVKEELSVAKVRHLDRENCLILPVLIDNVRPPSSIAHIKYANFCSWQLKEAYLAALRELLEALGVDLQQHTSSTELQLFQKHLTKLIKLKGSADSIAQVYFQLERLCFDFFKRDISQLISWFHETVTKTWDASDYSNTLESFERAFIDSESNGESATRVIQLSRALFEDYCYLGQLLPEESFDVVYSRIWRSENRARQLSAMLYAIILEVDHMLAS